MYLKAVFVCLDRSPAEREQQNIKKLVSDLRKLGNTEKMKRVDVEVITESGEGE